MDVKQLHRRACAEFGQRVHAVGEDQWHEPTPNEGWDVRDLVAHLVDECHWTPYLLGGGTVEDAGDRFSGDPLGEDPVGAWDAASAEAVSAAADVDLDRTVHLSFGDFPASFYLTQLFTDHLVHAWDLARAIGGDERLDPELVAACAEWFASQEDAYRSAGVIAERQPVPEDADTQQRLLAAFGRRP